MKKLFPLFLSLLFTLSLRAENDFALIVIKTNPKAYQFTTSDGRTYESVLKYEQLLDIFPEVGTEVCAIPAPGFLSRTNPEHRKLENSELKIAYLNSHGDQVSLFCNRVGRTDSAGMTVCSVQKVCLNPDDWLIFKRYVHCIELSDESKWSIDYIPNLSEGSEVIVSRVLSRP